MDFVQIAKDFGIQTAFSAALLFGIWRAGRWMATNLIEPLAARHIVFLDRIEKSTIDHTAALSSIAEAQRQQIELLKSVQCLNGNCDNFRPCASPNPTNGGRIKGEKT